MSEYFVAQCFCCVGCKNRRVTIYFSSLEKSTLLDCNERCYKRRWDVTEKNRSKPYTNKDKVDQKQITKGLWYYGLDDVEM